MASIILMCKRSASITAAGLALGSLLLAGSPAGAQSYYAPNIDQRQDYQQQRIQQGVDSGALTHGETRYLEKEQGRIDRAEDRMRADGRLSPRERERLEQMENRASRDIHRLEDNNRTTDGWGGNNNSGWSGHTNSGWGGDNHDRRFDRREAYQDHDRGWDRRDNDRRDRDHGWDQRNNGWRGAGYTQGGNGYNHGWQGNGNYGGRGNYPGGNGYTPSGTTTAGYTQGQGNHGYGWHGNNPAGNGTAPVGTTTNGTTTAGYTQGQGNRGYGWHGNNPAGSGTAPVGTTTNGTTTANARGWQGYGRNGQQGTYQQPGAQVGARPSQPAAWQGQQQYQRPSFQGAQPQMRPNQPAPWQGQQYQQARSPMPQTAMRPNFNMAPRQSNMMGGLVNRANFSAPGGGFRRR